MVLPVSAADMTTPRVLRIYHSGRTKAHRARDAALVAAGVDLQLLVPSNWTEGGAEEELTSETYGLHELPVTRPDDVNRHVYASTASLKRLIDEVGPEVIDLHEEPLSAVTHQVLSVVSPEVKVLFYSAQNLDKRYPPPFPAWERQAFARAVAAYPCSRQAASVLRARGFRGHVEVLPLGYDPAIFSSGSQRHDDDVFSCAVVGRLVPEKGLLDALQAFAGLVRQRPSVLRVVGDGPLRGELEAWVSQQGLSASVIFTGRLDTNGVAAVYRSSHVTLVPSMPTARWVEQFGRMIVESQASGSVVLGYASGSIPEVSAGAALVCAEGDRLGLERALVDLAEDPQLWDRLRDRGRRMAQQRTWSEVAGRHAQLYAQTSALSPMPVGPRARVGSDPEFGTPAVSLGGVTRPFALPVLRSFPVVAKTFARFVR